MIVATPTAGLRGALGLVRDAGKRVPVVWVCKGFEQASAKLPHQVVAETLAADAPCGALSGPSFALEVARGLPTALTMAAADAGLAQTLARELHQRRLRVYFSDDVTGVELGGAVKNVIAIADRHLRRARTRPERPRRARHARSRRGHAARGRPRRPP